MDEYFGSWSSRRPPPPLSANVGCNHDLNLSTSDASSLTAENIKDVFRRPATADDCTAWTDEKHNFYLRRLELSFVEQLYQLKSSLAHCPEQNLREKNISQEQRMINVDNDSEQNGCWQNLNCVRGVSLPCSISASSRDSVMFKGTYSLKHMDMHCHPSSAEVPAFPKKGMISNGTPTCSPEFSSFNRCDEDLSYLIREGTGQNFLDEDSQSTSNTESRRKRLKTASDDGSHQEISYSGFLSHQ